jgi:hypothetical protein
MKKKKDKLRDMDFFVSARKMTKEDEEAVIAYIRKHKSKSGSKSKRKRAA